jgi:tRNA pseudouridine38-40 synthase
MSIVLQLAYDGTNFFGWQKTKEGPSIEESLEKAISEILQHDVLLQAASRTDRGVHAKGQIVHFLTEREVEPKKLLLGLNALLPADVRVVNASNCSPSFHPTLDVTGKEYRYTLALGAAQQPLFRHMAWHVPKFRFGEDVVDAIPHLVGERDFKAFCNERKGITYSSTVRDLQMINLEEKDSLLTFFLVDRKSVV